MASKFSGVLKTAREHEPIEQLPELETVDTLFHGKQDPIRDPVREPFREMEPVAPRRPGRPRAKNSDPNYDQYSVFLRVDTQKAFKIICEGMDVEMSEVVQGLVTDWLRDQVNAPPGTDPADVVNGLFDSFKKEKGAGYVG